VRGIAILLACIALPVAADPTVDGPMTRADLSTRDRIERCGGVVILAISQGPSPVLVRSLRTLAFAAMSEGAKSEDAQQAMAAWADAYVATEGGLAIFRQDRPRCLALAGALEQ
jgi:hypothetical protein